MSSTEVRRNDERSRYELVASGEVIGIADYHETGDAVVFPHTVIQPEYRDQGNGEILVRGALDDVRRHGKVIVPSCWYVRQFVDLHPEYADLLADP
jgi:predicted GNAT family acetyltransferase